MAEARGSVRVCVRGPQADVQVIGWGRMHESLPLRRYAELCLGQGIVIFRIDLRHCTYLDSTFLGTLLHLRRCARRQAGGDVVLVSPSPECRRLLQQIGIAELFPTLTAEEAPAAWQELKAGCEDAVAFNRSVVEAHQELAGLGGVAGAQFQAVARCLARDCAPTPHPAPDAAPEATGNSNDVKNRSAP